MSGPKLRFCPESNDLLYPKEDRERKRLVYMCRSCGHVEDADPSDWCVYRNEVHHTAREKTVILQVCHHHIKVACQADYQPLRTSIRLLPNRTSSRPRFLSAGRSLRPHTATHN
jgi:DNA-directed RNA polymerase subunit M/transcription elongation factor TFIIS